MTTSENFLRAAFNSVKARIRKTIIYSAFETASFIREAPELIKKEWDQFKEEISSESERLENVNNEEVVSIDDIDFKPEFNLSPRNKIDNIRKKIAKLNNLIEEIH